MTMARLPENSPFAGIPSADFIDIMLQGGERADEAAYYLLHDRVNPQLRGRFEGYRCLLADDFEDVLEDFFLYLREGKGGENHTPYQSLQRIRNREVFEAWIVRTFRNYLTLRAEAEKRVLFSDLPADNIADTAALSGIAVAGYSACTGYTDRTSYATGIDNNACAYRSDALLTDEQTLSNAANLIAYAHQTFNPHYRFVLLRAMLTMLNPQQALPNEEVAKALGMSPLAYRVTGHRAKCRLAKCRDRLLRDESLPLDDTHRQMAQHINDNFSHLYPTLLVYYNQAVDSLPSAVAVRQLRKRHFEETGRLLHDPQTTYSAKLTVTGFWNKLNRWMIV